MLRLEGLRRVMLKRLRKVLLLLRLLQAMHCVRVLLSASAMRGAGGACTVAEHEAEVLGLREESSRGPVKAGVDVRHERDAGARERECAV